MSPPKERGELGLQLYQRNERGELEVIECFGMKLHDGDDLGHAIQSMATALKQRLDLHGWALGCEDRVIVGPIPIALVVLKGGKDDG